jgi:hypothetical protein
MGYLKLALFAENILDFYGKAEDVFPHSTGYKE